MRLPETPDVEGATFSMRATLLLLVAGLFATFVVPLTVTNAPGTALATWFAGTAKNFPNPTGTTAVAVFPLVPGVIWKLTNGSGPP